MRERSTYRPTMTSEQYRRVHRDYRGWVGGSPYLLYLDPETGETVYGPVEFISATEARQLAAVAQ